MTVNKDIADVLERMGTLLEIKGDLIFKIRAYYKAAENIANLAEDIRDLRREKRLSEIAGVGKTLEEKICEYLDTGRMSAYQELTAEVPESLLEIVRIPSVGPKKAKLFFEQLGVRSVAELEAAVAKGRLDGLPGIKEKTLENIRNGIKVLRAGQERMNLGAATAVAEEFVAALKAVPGVKDVTVAGSLRRMRETIRDIDLLVDASDPALVMSTFVGLPRVKSVNVQGETKSSVLTQDNVQVDVRVVEPKSYGAALLYFTGSKNFNVKIRQLAIKQGQKVSEYGIYKVKGEKETWLAGRTEKECFEALGLPDIPPELREDIGEEELFSGRKLPELITLKDIKGELHVHSTWSDGRNTIAEMAEAARARGYQYLAVSDHSERLKVAGGLSVESLKKKRKEIDALNAKLKDFTVLFGTELEIDSDGNLDYNDEVLGWFDIVVASIHSGFEQPRERLTRRIVRACESRFVNVIGHPTGVHLGKREPYDIDLKEVCRAARETNTALEINSFPIRLDLNSANVYFARSQGNKFVINTDSHAVAHLEHMKYGVAMARRGWLTRKDVLNTLSWPQLKKALVKK